ncbi:MAG: MFS transporter [Nitrolancea sp.]
MKKPSLGLSRDNTRIFVAMSFNEGAFGVYQTLWPLYIAALGANPAQIGVVLGLMGVLRLFALMPSGIASDHIPPRRLIVGARTMTALSMFLFGVAQSWWQLIPMGMIMAVGNIAFPSISSTIAEVAGSGRQRTRAFTLIYTVGPALALLATPAIGGIVADLFGLRATLFVAAGFTAVAVSVFSTITPRPIQQHSGPPVTYRSTISQRPILLLCLLEMATIFTLTLGMTLVPNYLQDVRGIDTGTIGILGSASAIGSIGIWLIISRVRPFDQPLLAIGLSIVAVGGTLGILVLGRSIFLFAIAYVLRGGYPVAWSLFSAAFGEIVDERYRQRAFALAEIMGGTGFALAPFAAGWLYEFKPVTPLIAGFLLVIPLSLGLQLIHRSVRVHQPALIEEPV